MMRCFQRERRGAALITCAAVAALIVASTSNLGVGRASQRSASRAADRGVNVYVDPLASSTLWVATMDPGAASDGTSLSVINYIYNGLVRLVYNHKTRRLDVAPDLAAALPTVSRNGLVYTFKLRPDARFSDGKRVTARDVVYSINRALLPAEKSPLASFFLGDILGAGDVVAGKATMTRGLKAIGDDTVEITLARPVAYFLYAFATPAGDVLEQTVAPGANLTTNPALVVGAGPFLIKDHTWAYRGQITLVPNPYYYDARAIKLKEVDIPFVGTALTVFKGYESGQFLNSYVPAAEVPRFQGRPDFYHAPAPGDMWLAMNPRVAPFTDLHFRRAIAYGINRDAIVRGTEHNSKYRLDGWYPTGIVGYDPTIGPRVPHYDPTSARKELDLARKDLGAIPTIELEYPSENEDWGRDFLQVQSDLREVGITMNLKSVPGNTWIADINSHKASFTASNWIDDYPDPHDFSEVLVGTGGQANAGNYSNPTVDALFARAAVERDAATRERLYKQAQEIILNDAAVVPLYQFSIQWVISPKVHGFELTPFGLGPIGGNWANVTISA